jgi:hypothetical protein
MSPECVKSKKASYEVRMGVRGLKQLSGIDTD